MVVLDFPPFHQYSPTQDDLIGQGSRDRCNKFHIVEIVKYTTILVNTGFQALICKVKLNGFVDLSDLGSVICVVPVLKVGQTSCEELCWPSEGEQRGPILLPSKSIYR